MRRRHSGKPEIVRRLTAGPTQRMLPPRPPPTAYFPSSEPAVTTRHVQLNPATLWKSLTNPRRLTLIAGPCVIENEALCFRVAATLQKTCARLGLHYVFKASFDKANRTSGKSFRGPGLDEGLAVLAKVRARFGLSVLTDVHTEEQARIAAGTVDILQIPAFLCRQTDLINTAVATGRIVNIKKGQFLSPTEMGQVVKKAVASGAKRLLLTERGTTFGYNNLVSDMRAVPLLKSYGWQIGRAA